MPESLNPVDPYLTDEEYRDTFNHVVRPCVDLVVCHQGLILARRNIKPFKNTWSLPGGRLRYKVPMLETAHNVARDELGVEVSIEDQIIGYIDYLNDGEYLHSISLVFLAKVLSGIPRPRSQASEIEVFTEIPENTHPYHVAFLRANWQKISEQF